MATLRQAPLRWGSASNASQPSGPVESAEPAGEFTSSLLHQHVYSKAGEVKEAPSLTSSEFRKHVYSNAGEVVVSGFPVPLVPQRVRAEPAPPLLGPPGEPALPCGQPLVGERRRGSAELAKEIAADPSRLRNAIGMLESKFYAQGSLATKNSKLTVAEDIARCAGFTQLYPLSERLLVTVGAALMGASYSSGASYIAELKLRHVELDHAIGPALGRRITKVTDALERGLGPKSKAPEITPRQVPGDPLTSEGGPVLGALRSFVVASAWLLREVELADLDASPRNIRLLEDGRGVELLLPMSKTDQRGNGAARCLACHCSLGWQDGAPPASSCGPCSLRRQLQVIEETFGLKFGSPEADNFPLFPDADGGRPPKATVIKAWSVALGTPVKGHSPRRSGAKFRARSGWAVYMVQFLGRWAGATVLEYIEEALANRTHAWSLSSSSSGPAQVASQALPLPISGNIQDAEVLSLSRRAELADEALSSLQEQMNIQKSSLDNLLAVSADDSIVATAANFHYLPQGALEWPQPLWTTLCGWRFGGAASCTIYPASKLNLVEERPWCSRCASRRAAGMGKVIGDSLAN